MIGLSPLPPAHPEAFQRLSVRPSTVFYHSFSLARGRSPSFASTPTDYAPCSDSLSLRLRTFTFLTSPVRVTRRLIMQKARRHPASAGLRPLVSAWFQDLFHPGTPRPFHLSLTVLCTIGLLSVFSLTGWCRLIQRGFLRSPPTQDSQPTSALTRTGLSPSVVPFPKGFRFACWLDVGSYYPALAVTKTVWAAPASLATTTGITLVFCSCGYLDVSVHRVCFPPKGGMMVLQTTGLPHSDTCGSAPASGSPQRFVACHALHRHQKP